MPREPDVLLIRVGAYPVCWRRWSIGSNVKHFATEQLAVGCSWFDTCVGWVMSGDKVLVRLSV